MGIIANTVIEPVFRCALDVFTPVGAVILVMIDCIVHQIRIVTSFKDLHRAGAICEEAKVHHGAPLDGTVMDTDHLDRELGVSRAVQREFIRGCIELVLNACVEEIKVSLILEVPCAKQAEEVPEASKR